MCTPESAHGAGKKFPSALIVTSLILSCLLTRIARGLPQDTVAAEVAEQIQQLKSNDPNARVVAVRRLREIGPGSKEAMGALIAALKDDPEPWVREYAAESLGYIGSGEPEITRALANALRDPKPWVRNYAAAALERLGSASPDVISALITDLRDQAQGEEGKCYAVDALGSIGTSSPDAIDAIMGALNDKSDDVQRHAIHALGMLRTDSPYLTEAIHALSTALNHLGPTAKGRAAQALGRFGPPAQEAVPVLTDVLNDKAGDPGVRAQAAAALGEIGPGAQKAVPALIEVLKDNAGDPGVRASAATALGEIGPGAQEAVSALVAALKDPNPEVQRVSAFALDRIGQAAKEAVSPLIDALHSSAPEVKAQAAYALGDIAPGAAEVVRALGDALADGDPEVGAHAAVMLAKIGPNAQEAVPKLKDALKDRGKPKVALQAANALSKIVPGSSDTIVALTAVLKDKDSAPEVRKEAADALASIAANARDSRRIDLIAPLEQAVAALGEDTSFGPNYHAARGALDLLRTMQPLPQRLIDEIGRHPVVTRAVAAYAGLVLVFVALLFLYPLALLRVGQAASGLSDVPTLNKLIGVGEAVFIFGFFRFHPRVLDAWIAKHIDAARKQFNSMTTVRDREVHVDEVPVELDRTVIPGLRPKDLKQAFGRNHTCILLWGQGGSGKTSIACEIARWVMSDDRDTRPCLQRMLPILIEQDSNLDVGKDQDVLTEVIRGRVKELTGGVDAPTSDLVRSLLKRKRILLIADGLSELNEATRNMIRPMNPAFDANALVVTSRLEENLDGVAKTVLHPQRIKGNRLASFIEAYLSRSGKRGLFDDTEFFDGCKRLSSLVGERDSTVLLAKLYAEQMIALKESQAGGNLPENIPDLMLEYLNQISRRDPRMDDRAANAAAKIIAWCCLRNTLRPVPADLGAVLNALGPEGEAHLKHLEQNLRLVETIGVARDRVRFALDPLAEYLAGLYFVEQYRDNEGSWRDVLAKADDAPGAPNAIKGFLLALGDCCIVKGPDYHVPAFVGEELARRAGMDRPEQKGRPEPGGVKLISGLSPSSAAAQKRVA